MYLSFTNPAAYAAQNALRTHTGNFSSSVERLATGKKINRAADDPSGLAIVSKLKAEMVSADSALGSITSLLQDIRADFVQASTGTPTTGDLDALQAAINEKITAISALGAQTSFNGFDLLAGTQNFNIQTGINQGDTTSLLFQAGGGTSFEGIAIDITHEQGGSDAGHLVEGVTTAGFSLDQLSVNAVNVNAQDGGDYAMTTNGLDVIDTLINNVSRMRSTVGGYTNSLESQLEVLFDFQANLDSSRSIREDVDIAKESAELSKQQVLREGAATVLAAANTNYETVITLLP